MEAHCILAIVEHRDACQRPPCNIGVRGRRLRLVLGLVSLGCAVALAVVLVAQPIAAYWRLAVYVPLHLGLLGIAQSRSGVCAVYAALGAWELERNGPQQVPDRNLEAQFKQRAKKILVQTGISSVIASLLLLLF
jgi:hypothetical protein